MSWIVGAVTVAVALLVYAQLKRRNAAGIATSMRARGAQVTGLVGRSLLRRTWLKIRSALATRQRRLEMEKRYHMQVAEEAAEMMGNMKGAFMKLGQVLSFAHEGIPEHAREALARLQMDAPPMTFSIVREVVEGDLGPIDEHFRNIDAEPIAAASIGQVHRARLLDGTDVVLKVQYPGVATAISNDLKASHGLAFMISSVNHNIDAESVVDELKDRLIEELDYERELSNQQLFHDLWEGHPLIRIPRVYPQHSGPHVLCQEYCRGLRFAEFVEAATEQERRLAVHVLHDFIFDSMFRFCVFNGDPHPGNYIFQEDGGVTFVDFGCVKYFSPEFIEELRALNRALIEDDREGFERLLKQMQVVLPGRPYDLDQLWEFFCYHSEPFRKDETFTFTSEWVNQAFRVMDPTKQTRINLPKNFVFLNRITFGLNSIMLKLGASENFHRFHRRYNYPEERVPPALTRLGVRVPDRLAAPAPAPVERTSLAPSAPVQTWPPASDRGE